LSKSDKLVEVYKARTEMEAQVIRGLLDSFGIPCVFRSNAAPSVHMFTMNGLAEVKVMVLGSLADEAKKLINDNNADIREPDAN
jgi:hypothetical protein